jgi:hypothetical protein
LFKLPARPTFSTAEQSITKLAIDTVVRIHLVDAPFEDLSCSINTVRTRKPCPRIDVTNSDPVAFLSYVRADDEHERGRITLLRQRLEGEVRMQTGRPFKIFQDKADILWGQQWRERLDAELFNVTFLIPIVTPGYFHSSACRDEFDKFAVREKQLGKNTLILPVYYLQADELEEAPSDQRDAIASVLSSRNWADWRGLRFKDLQSPEVEHSIASMAMTIKSNMKLLESEIAASKAEPVVQKQAPLSEQVPFDLKNYSPDVPEARIVNASRKSGKTPFRTTYYAYTKEFDEIVHAEDLIDSESTATLESQLSRAYVRIVRKYKKEIQAAADAVKVLEMAEKPLVIFLIDNSGSLKDKGQMADIAGWIQILAETLDGLAVPTEILGFTTRTWKGGQSREKWLIDGKPPRPGRLNDLRHIVYKSTEQSPKEVRANLGLMASGRLLKENIDGEALLWAFDRSQDYSASRSIIIVLSDGAPVDDSTLLSNPPNILENHLISTIQWLSLHPQLNLYGIGIDHETNRYYPKGIPKIEVKQVGLGILQSLPIWLSNKGS